MREISFEHVREILIGEYKAEGHEVIEQEGVYYARLVLATEQGITHVTEMNLTRLADLIHGRMA